MNVIFRSSSPVELLLIRDLLPAGQAEIVDAAVAMAGADTDHKEDMIEPSGQVRITAMWRPGEFNQFAKEVVPVGCTDFALVGPEDELQPLMEMLRARGWRIE
jgi:hypothetical protein